MLKEVEALTPTTKKLKINIPSEVIEEEILNAYNDLRLRAKIPGFRAGKAPLAILEKKFGKDIEAQVIEKIVPEYYLKAIKEAQILPITYPHIGEKLELVRKGAGTSGFQPLYFTATVEVKPEVQDLKYDGITLAETQFTVKEDEVETYIKFLLEGRAVLKVSEGPISEGDVAIINCEAFIDGREAAELSLKNDYPFILGSHAMPAEFSDAFAGKKKGDMFEVKINFDGNEPNKTIAGKEVLFKVSIAEMKERVLPALDDEFVKGFDCKTVEELKQKININIGKRKKKQIENDYKRKLIDYLIGNHAVDIPDSLAAQELDFEIDEAKQNALRSGKPVKSDEDLRKDLEPAARKNVKTMLILDAIGKKEKIEVTENDINTALEEIASQNGLKQEEVKKLYLMRDGSLDGLKNKVFSDKVLELILSKAIIKKNSD